MKKICTYCFHDVESELEDFTFPGLQLRDSFCCKDQKACKIREEAVYDKEYGVLLGNTPSKE